MSAACLVTTDSYFLTGSLKTILPSEILWARRVISLYDFNRRYIWLEKLVSLSVMAKLMVCLKDMVCRSGADGWLD